MMDINRLAFRHVFYLTLLLRREWFLPTLARLRESQYLPADELRALQLRELNRLLRHARQNTPFYRERLPDSLQSLDDLSTLPVLTKDDLRNRASELMTRHGVSQRLKTSGGSTGAPVTLLKDAAGVAQEMAATQRGYEWAGIGIGDRQARFWGVPHTPKARLRARLIDFVCNRRRISAFAFDQNTLREAHVALQRFKPDYFYGYVSMLREFAAFTQTDSTTPPLCPRAIIATAEVLTNPDRALLQEAFNTKVYNEYGCGEVGSIAHECEQGALHINAENLFLEVLDDGGRPVSAGESGEFAVTDLTNYSTPLIRYRLGDFGALRESDCPCGRTLPIITTLYGREYDALVNTNGAIFHGEFFLYIVEDAKNNGAPLSGIQFLQHQNLDITVKLVCKNDNFSALSNFIENQLRLRFDSTVKIAFERTSAIPREPSGKLRVVKRDSPNPTFQHSPNE